MPVHRIRNHPLLKRAVLIAGVEWTVKEAWLGLDGKTDYVDLEDGDGDRTGFSADYVRELIAKGEGQGADQ